MLETDVRSALLDAADELLARFGYRKTTIEDVARAAGVGKGTVYLHFGSKQELALATIDRLVDRVVERLEAIAAGAEGAAAKLRAMLVARVLIRFDAVARSLASLDELLGAIRPALLERRKRWFEREARVLARVLAAAPELDVPRPDRTARDLLAATDAFLPYSLTAAETGRRAAIHAQLGRIADLLISGLLHHPPTTATDERRP